MDFHDEVRNALHIHGPLPSNVGFELVYWPTFHPPLGLRCVGDEVEVWSPDDVASCEISCQRFQALAEALIAAPRAEHDQTGRDGIVVLLRVGRLATERWTACDSLDDPILTFARTFLDELERYCDEAWVRAALIDIRRYFRVRST